MKLASKLKKSETVPMSPSLSISSSEAVSTVRLYFFNVEKCILLNDSSRCRKDVAESYNEPKSSLTTGSISVIVDDGFCGSGRLNMRDTISRSFFSK